VKGPTFFSEQGPAESKAGPVLDAINVNDYTEMAKLAYFQLFVPSYVQFQKWTSTEIFFYAIFKVVPEVF